MIHVICGGRSSQKTTKIKNEFLKNKGFGFVCEKICKNGYVIGYNLLNLITNEVTPYIIDKEYYLNNFKNKISNIRYEFNIKAYDLIEEEFKNAFTKYESYYLDEIGKIELTKHEGFYKILIELIKISKSSDVYLTVSNDNLKFLIELINKYSGEYIIKRTTSLAAIILASGYSKRFNNKNKLLINNKGISFFESILQKVIKADVFSEIIVVTRFDEIKDICKNYWNITTINNDKAYEGISASIKIGVKRANELNMNAYAFIQSDQPFLKSETIKKIALEYLNNSENIIVPKYMDTLGSPKIFPESLYSELMELLNDQGGRTILKKHENLVRIVEVDNMKENIDIDTQKEYKENFLEDE